MNRMAVPRRLLAWLLASALTGPALASPEADLLKRLRSDYPGTQWDEARPSLITGLFEVVTGRNIVYAEPTGRYLVFGHIWDMPAQADLTAARKLTLAKVTASQLPPEDALVVRRSNQARLRVAIFSDPACGYCRALEKTLNQLPQLEVAVYLAPMQPGARALADAVWCAPDRSSAWLDQMLNGRAPAAGACDTAALDRNLALARSLGIQGTPTLVAEDGRVLPGAASAPEILAWLGQPSSTEVSR